MKEKKSSRAVVPFEERPDAGALRGKFGVPADERVEVVVGPDHEDFVWNSWMLALIMALPLLAQVPGAVVGSSSLSWGVLATGLAVAAGLAVGASGLGQLGAPRLLGTERGLYQRRWLKDPIFVPWEDVLEIESDLPFLAEFRVHLREGAPVLSELPERTVTSWSTSKDSRVMGSNSLWDVGERKLDGLRDLLDQNAVHSFTREVEAADEPDRLPRSDETPDSNENER